MLTARRIGSPATLVLLLTPELDPALAADANDAESTLFVLRTLLDDDLAAIGVAK